MECIFKILSYLEVKICHKHKKRLRSPLLLSKLLQRRRRRKKRAQLYPSIKIYRMNKMELVLSVSRIDTRGTS